MVFLGDFIRVMRVCNWYQTSTLTLLYCCSWNNCAVNLNFEWNGFGRFNRVTDSQELQQYLFSYCCFFACLSFACPPFSYGVLLVCFFVRLFFSDLPILGDVRSIPKSYLFSRAKILVSYTAREFHWKRVTPFKCLLKNTIFLFIHEKS